jgi:prepilin-type N-terminal cleavage/methylation domain-containing protein
MAENRKRQDGRNNVDKRVKVREKLLSGFTLIEVLMTIVVLAILAAVAVPGFSVWLPNYRLKAAARFSWLS